MEPYDTSRRNEDDFHTQALRTTDPTDPFVRFATTDPEVEPEPVVGGSVKHPARARTGLVVIVALLVELIAILGGANQWVADRIQSHTNLVSTPDLFARTMLTYSWRFSPPGGHDTGHAWSAQLLSVVAFLVLSVLLIIPAVGRHVTFFRAFFGVWGAVVLATALARMVVPAVASASVSGGAGGVSRLSRVLFYSSDSKTVAASIALGFVVALIAATVAVATRRRPAVAVVSPAVVAAESPLPTPPPPYYGAEGGDPSFDRGVGSYGGFDEHGYPSNVVRSAGYDPADQPTTSYNDLSGFDRHDSGAGEADFNEPRYTAADQPAPASSDTDRTAAIPVATDSPDDVPSSATDATGPTSPAEEPTVETSSAEERTTDRATAVPEIGPNDTRQFPVITDDTPAPDVASEDVADVPNAVPPTEATPAIAQPTAAEPEQDRSEPEAVPPALTPEERASLLDPPRLTPTRDWPERTAPGPAAPPVAPPTAGGRPRPDGTSAFPRPDVSAEFPQPTEPDHDGFDDEELPPRQT